MKLTVKPENILETIALQTRKELSPFLNVLKFAKLNPAPKRLLDVAGRLNTALLSASSIQI